MMKQILLSFSSLLVFLLHCTTTLAQSPAQAPAQAPAVLPLVQSPAPSTPPPTLPPTLPTPSGEINITTILEKAGKFSTLIWLLGNTQVGDRINTQINKASKALTVFAPTDAAFSTLKSGLLNSLNDQQRVQLVLFHILTSYISLSQFKAVSNPLHTEAGENDKGHFPLNVTTAGNQVSLSTGVVTSSLAKTIYTDSQLAVYEVDKVLLPTQIFSHISSVVAPSPQAPPTFSTPVVASSATGLIRHAALSFGVAAIAVFSL